MNGKYKKILSEMDKMREDVNTLKNQLLGVTNALNELKNQLTSVSIAAMKGDDKPQSYGSLILAEVEALRKKLEGFTAEGLRNMINDVAALKNKVEDNVRGMEEFSLAELKGELLKLADMMTV